MALLTAHEARNGGHQTAFSYRALQRICRLPSRVLLPKVVEEFRSIWVAKYDPRALSTSQGGGSDDTNNE